MVTGYSVFPWNSPLSNNHGEELWILKTLIKIFYIREKVKNS
jgi:hypothetical protein